MFLILFMIACNDPCESEGRILDITRVIDDTGDTGADTGSEGGEDG
ncbi:hypothetical protein HON52_04840 [Candidatus Uhrbacteria bacterium]|jgi:hypothetical protein|nr:hypothetical protein [Candidatus Uhrbacteria bacterium]